MQRHRSSNGHGAETKKRVTLREFYAHRLSLRHNNQNLIFRAGKLFQQYVVDAYVKIESNNLEFIRRNQKQLRVEEYQGLIDHISRRASVEQVDIGRMYILPSTYIVSISKK